MIELAQHIELLLLENDCVIIPDFGGFVTHETPASYLKEEGLFLPPTRTIGFNPQLKLNDGVLTQSYMATYGTDFADATRLISRDVKKLTEILYREGKVSLPNIGEISYDIQRKYKFISYDSELPSPAFYGLDSFEMYELSTLSQQSRVWEATIPRKEDKSYHIRINRTYFQNAVAGIVALILFFAYSTRIENTGILHSDQAGILPEELFRQLEKHSMAFIPLQTGSHTMQQPKQVPTASKISAEKTRVSKPVAVREVKVSKPQEEPATAIKQLSCTAEHPFHIIIAGGVTKKNADTLVAQLKKEGFPEAQVLHSGDKIRVSILSFDNRNEAVRQMMELRKNDAYKNAWLLAK